MNAPKIILELVERFAANEAAYRSTQYKEAQARIEFIDPLFEALGWDMSNRRGLAEPYKEVIHEDVLKIGRSTKAPDYGFRVGKERRFFVEAKHPGLDLGKQTEPAYQLRRYAWNAKLPLSILTDFEEFAVYDCRIQPEAEDRPTTARVLYVRFTEYATRWSEIATLFGRDAVASGSLEKYAEEVRTKKGTVQVDDAFLGEIEGWRVLLAEDIARHNSLSARDLNFAVQQTIDRIVFLRICEDRGIEEYGRLRSLLTGLKTYEGLRQLFWHADQRYNSGLFHFSDERGRAEPPDALTPRIVIADECLKAIINRLYYPESPYEFSILSADILGQVYERFLGKVIRLTSEHTVVVDDKPEVKKAGGVYYTPSFVVDYIVDHTLRRLLTGKTPKQAAKLKILDPACGSGSFLLSAYQYLLDWHRDWYQENNPEKHPRAILKIGASDWRLSPAERKRILLDNIFGVDIDTQAVEVTKLSLLLKVLEGESAASLTSQLKLFHERALPDLAENIRCGNSLIGADFYTSAQAALLDEEEREIVNVFDWEDSFRAVFSGKMRGFDAVVGNPPYGYMIPPSHQAYYDDAYRHQDYQKDMYLLFLERYSRLLKVQGLLGVIVSNTWLQSVKLRSIRSHLATQYEWSRVLLLPEKVFRAVVDTHVLLFKKIEEGKADDCSVAVDVRRHGKIVESHSLPRSAIPSGGEPINVAAPLASQRLARKIHEISRPLSSACDVYNGIKPFEKGKGDPPQTAKIAKDQPYVAEGARPDPSWSPLLRGSLIRRYELLWDNDYWVRYGKWLAAPRDPAIFSAPEKIVVRQTGDSIVATLIPSGYIARNNMHILLPRAEGDDLRYVLGIMNSRLMDFVYTMMNPEKGEALAEVKKYHVEQLPIRAGSGDARRVALRGKIVALVELALSLGARMLREGNPRTRTSLQQQRRGALVQIDQLVFEVYDLTADEVALVEESTSQLDAEQ